MPGNSNMRFVFGDINRDGNADFVVTHDAGIVFFGDGEGNFSNADYNLPQYSYPVGGPDLGDVNNDGGQDLAYVDLDGGLKVWTFHAATSQWVELSGTLPVAGNYQELQLCDFNSDGITDLAAFGDAQLTVWKNTLFGPQNIVWTQEFNTITSDNGDCNAFRAGGDVDRNGYPDITLVEKEGSWPSDQNHLKCFKETTPVIEASIKAVFPKGLEVFRQGAVQFADWICAVSSSSQAMVRIDYSLRGKLGPWTELTAGTANSGRFQWIIPQTISSNNCFVKYTLIDGNDTLEALTKKAFTILGEDGIEADFIADSTTVYPGSTIQFTDQSLGLITSWEWDFDNDGIIDATTRNPEYSYSQSGTYTVKLSVSDGSSTQTEVKTDYITVLSLVGLQEKAEGPEFFIYPNPTNGKFQITSSKFQINSKFQFSNARIEVVDLYGKLVMCSPLHRVGEGPGVGAGFPQPATRNPQLDISHLPPGLYLVRLTNGTSFHSQKLIIYK
jgi:PKD repeat protein